MFRLIGIVAVYGFALYGMVKYLERPVINSVTNAEGAREVGEGGPQGNGS